MVGVTLFTCVRECVLVFAFVPVKTVRDWTGYGEHWQANRD